MKTVIMNIVHAICSFVKVHTITSVVTGAAIILTAVGTPAVVLGYRHQQGILAEEQRIATELVEQEAGLPSQEEPEVAAQVEAEAQAKAEAEQKAKEETEASAKAEAEKKAQEEAAAKAEAEKQETAQQEEQKTETSRVSEKKPETTNTSNKNNGSTSSQTVVQTANTDTGISWDGVSPIIYTYPDGTQSTTPIDGATYEVVPGWIGTYETARDQVGRPYNSICSSCGKEVGGGGNDTCLQIPREGYCVNCGVHLQALTCHTCAPGTDTDFILYCEDCGKISGNGLNGTCLQYWAFENDCTNCGEVVPVNTCHTCTSGCMYCQKKMGNGTNGTCYRDYFGSSNCPSCNAAVPINTCHSCG